MVLKLGRAFKRFGRSIRRGARTLRKRGLKQVRRSGRRLLEGAKKRGEKIIKDIIKDPSKIADLPGDVVREGRQLLAGEARKTAEEILGEAIRSGSKAAFDAAEKRAIKAGVPPDIAKGTRRRLETVARKKVSEKVKEKTGIDVNPQSNVAVAPTRLGRPSGNPRPPTGSDIEKLLKARGMSAEDIANVISRMSKK